MASSFALNSFYGGSKGTSSKGRDSASTDTELNSVTTRRKAGRPSVSQNKGKKGVKKAVLVVKQQVAI